jgi:suppressor of G2 allele of SKP1
MEHVPGLTEAHGAFLDENYQHAVLKYGESLAGCEDTSVSQHIRLARCRALMKLGKHMEALADANEALSISHSAVGLYRKGRAAFALNEYESAMEAFNGASKLLTDSSPRGLVIKCQRWARKCEAELEDESSDDSDSEIEEVADSTPTQTAAPAVASSSAPASAPTPAPAPAPAAPTVPRVQRDWYQTQETVTVSVLVKGVDADASEVVFTPRNISASLRLPSGSDYVVDIDLAASVVPEQCSYSINKYKAEFVLKKEFAAMWAGLESGQVASAVAPVVAPAPSSDAKATVAQPYAATSKQPKDWDALEREVEKEDEEPEGEAALHKLFQQIYANASDETRRAMVKSYQTSGGTVLSTNWDEVGTTDYEEKREAPDGMEWKKWG